MKPSSSAQNLMSGSLKPENISLASEKTVSSLQVVIVSASIGAGHDYAARELRERLIRVGVDVSVCDYVQGVALPLRLLLRSYETLVNHLPWLFNYVIVSTDEGSSWLLAFLVFLGCATSRRWLLRCTAGADAVVSTHALATQSLGELKRRGALEAPLASYLCDAGMHRLLFHQAVSLSMVLLEAVRPNAGEETALMPEWSSRWCGRSSEISYGHASVLHCIKNWGSGTAAKSSSYRQARSASTRAASSTPWPTCSPSVHLQPSLRSAGKMQRFAADWTRTRPLASSLLAGAPTSQASSLRPMSWCTAREAWLSGKR